EPSRHRMRNHAHNDAASVVQGRHDAARPLSELIDSMFNQHTARLLRWHSSVIENFLQFRGVRQQIPVGFVGIRPLVLLYSEGKPFADPEARRTRRKDPTLGREKVAPVVVDAPSSFFDYRKGFNTGERPRFENT